MNILQRLKRDIRAKMILRQVDKLYKETPELTYKECFIVVMELRGLNNTEAFKRVAGGGRW